MLHFVIVIGLFFSCIETSFPKPTVRFLEDENHDNDGDDFTENQGDCDDNNGWANPDMEEMCDGFDNDCNGEIDEIDLCSEEGQGEESLDPNQSTDGTDKPPSGCSTIIPNTSNKYLPFEWLSLLLLLIPRKTRKQRSLRGE